MKKWENGWWVMENPTGQYVSNHLAQSSGIMQSSRHPLSATYLPPASKGSHSWPSASSTQTASA